MLNKKNPGKILIVDNTMYVRSTIKKALTKKGYTVIEAQNGIDGIDEYRKHKPDLVIMDIELPLLDGIEATDAITKINKHAKILIVTGKYDLRDNVIDAGAIDVIRKPIKMETIIEKVNHLLRQPSPTKKIRKIKSQFGSGKDRDIGELSSNGVNSRNPSQSDVSENNEDVDFQRPTLNGLGQRKIEIDESAPEQLNTNNHRKTLGLGSLGSTINEPEVRHDLNKVRSGNNLGLEKTRPDSIIKRDAPLEAQKNQLTDNLSVNKSEVKAKTITTCIPVPRKYRKTDIAKEQENVKYEDDEYLNITNKEDKQPIEFISLKEPVNAINVKADDIKEDDIKMNEFNNDHKYIESEIIINIEEDVKENLERNPEETRLFDKNTDDDLIITDNIDLPSDNFDKSDDTSFINKIEQKEEPAIKVKVRHYINVPKLKQKYIEETSQEQSDNGNLDVDYIDPCKETLYNDPINEVLIDEMDDSDANVDFDDLEFTIGDDDTLDESFNSETLKDEKIDEQLIDDGDKNEGIDDFDNIEFEIG